MELEARSVGVKERPRLQTRLKGYKSDVSSLRKEIKEARAEVKREQLMTGGRRYGQGCPDTRTCPPAPSGGAWMRSPPEHADQEQRLLQINERARRGTEKLRQAQATALEAEAIGANIMNDLRSQVRPVF